MKIGFIGLGRMGKAMVLHMLEEGIDVAVYNRSPEKTEELKSEFSQMSLRGVKRRNDRVFGTLIPTYSLKELVLHLEPPRIIWIMVEHGKPVDDVIQQLISGVIGKEDIIIDGGNSFYKDSIRRAEELKTKNIHFLDIGTSGGIEGARNGACIMVGGEENVFNKVKPILQKISFPGGVAYFGASGAGHFVKMTHNGIEYGMLQAIAEGFAILEKGMPVAEPFSGVYTQNYSQEFCSAPHGYAIRTVHFDLHKVAENWSHGSVVRGWLLELLEKAFRENPKSKLQISNKIQNQKSKKNNFGWLSEFSGSVGGGSTGEWTVKTAEELGVDAPVIKGSYEARLKSQQKPTFAGKVISALRFQFGGHRD